MEMTATRFTRQKSCFECHEIKPAAEFYPHAKHKDGLSTRCRACTLADMARRWRAKHPEQPPWQMPTEKQCHGCGETKPIDDFHLNSTAKDGHQTRCKTCMNAASSAYNKTRPERHALLQREYAERHAAKIADKNLRWRLGVPLGTYAAMLASQDGKCGICATTDPGPRIKRFHVDHDEATGNVRGLLCSKCNQAIGLLGHSQETILASAAYLRRYASPLLLSEGAGI